MPDLANIAIRRDIQKTDAITNQKQLRTQRQLKIEQLMEVLVHRRINPKIIEVSGTNGRLKKHSGKPWQKRTKEL